RSSSRAGASGGEPLAPFRAPPLEDRASRAGRHPCTEAVPALPATHVRLVSPLQGEECDAKWEKEAREPAGQYRAGFTAIVVHSGDPPEGAGDATSAPRL